MNMWPLGQAVKTLASHAGIRGSIPLGVTIKTGTDAGLFEVILKKISFKSSCRGTCHFLFDHLPLNFP